MQPRHKFVRICSALACVAYVGLTACSSADDDLARFIDAARNLQGGGKRIVCVTLGKRGVLALVDDRPLAIEGRVVKAVDTTGAGDCFVGAVAAQLAAHKPINDALNYANIAASICVQRMGAAPSMPTAAEVENT